jgi:hypothetical protein
VRHRTMTYQAFPIEDLIFDKKSARRRFGRRAQ